MRYCERAAHDQEFWKGELRYAHHQVCAARKQVAKEAGPMSCRVPRKPSMVGDRNQGAGRGGPKECEYSNDANVSNANVCSFTAMASVCLSAYNVRFALQTHAWTRQCLSSSLSR